MDDFSRNKTHELELKLLVVAAIRRVAVKLSIRRTARTGRRRVREAAAAILWGAPTVQLAGLAIRRENHARFRRLLLLSSLWIVQIVTFGAWEAAHRVVAERALI